MFSSSTTSTTAAPANPAPANAASSSHRKDMRRVDLAIPYCQSSASSEDGKEGGDMSSTITTTLPMAAIFTKNKMIACLVYALQNWLSESSDQAARKPSSNPGILGVAMGFMAVIVNYLPLFLPPVPQNKARATAAPGTVPGVQ